MAKNAFMADALTGGTAGKLDDILHTVLADGNIAVVDDTANNYVYFYKYSASEAGAESSPSIIIPDSNVSGTGAWVLQTVYGAPGATLGVTFPRTKLLSIGNWDMDATANVDVAHGLTFGKIMGARAYILNDAGDALAPLDISLAGEPAGYLSVGGTNVSLYRIAGGIFDATGYDTAVYNRGYVIVDYID